MTAFVHTFSVAVLVLLFVSCPSLTSAGSRRVRSHYWQAMKDEYAEGAVTLSALAPTQPQQILTSLSGSLDVVTVTWVTMAGTNTSIIQWGDVSSPSFDHSAEGSSFDFVDLEPAHNLRVIHTAHMTAVKPGSSLRYRVGDAATGAWSSNLTFTAPTAGNELLTIIVYGDLGYLNAQSMKLVTAEVQAGSAHLVLHTGDYAYDLNTNNGTYGDIFCNSLQPVASRVPYLGVQGNHENAHNVSHWRNRFTAYQDLGQASASNTNLWFSWDVISGGARVHFAALDTEMYYNEQYADQRKAQYAWLDLDLRKARASSDWVIVYGHRPLYCSNLDTLSDCTSDAKVLRDGYQGKYGMDDLLAQHNVDLYLTAHEHDYERTLPIYRGQFEPQPNHTYTNPRFPIHVVSGSAGCQEGLEYFDEYLFPAWSVVRSPTYGYGHLVVHNATHMYWEQVLDEGKGGLDWLWVERDQTRRGQQRMDTTQMPWPSAE